MGTYYFILNDTKRHCVHYGNNFKHCPMRENKDIHYAMMNYLMDNQGDIVRMLNDDGDNPELYEYERVDLKKIMSENTKEMYK